MIRKWTSWLGGSARVPDPPVRVPVDLADAALWADPVPAWDWLRRHAPLADVAGGGHLLTRHADVMAALADPSLGNAPSRMSVLAPRQRGQHVAADVAAHIPPFLDKPAHVPVRQALSSAFHRVMKSAPLWLPDLARAAVAPCRGQTVDLPGRIARPFCADVMARFIGLPPDRQAIGAASEGFFHLFAPIRDRAMLDHANAALGAARAFIARAVADRAQGPQDDLISHLLGAGLTPAETADNALLVLADGIENIQAGIVMAFDLLARHPGRHDEAALREVLRLSTPGQIIPRVTRVETTLAGKSLGAGVPVFLALGSANLDPAAHPDPGRFDPGRDLSQVLIFGRGRHRCIGEPLGLLQIRAMVEALARAGARRADDRPLAYQPRFGHRWPVGMAITLP